MNGKFARQRFALTVLCIVLLFVLLVMIFATAYAQQLFRRIGRYTPEEPLSPELVATMTDPADSMDPDFTGPSLEPEDVTFPTDSVQIPDSEDVINILLIGQDRESGSARQRSDSMILCTVNKTRRTITMTSFLRDSYVQIPGYRAAKMNAAYAWGGMPLLKQTLAENFGVSVDACVEVDFSGFRKVIDLLGGVDIELTKEEADYLSKACGWSAAEGMNHLSGSQALDYSRLRAIDSDFGRTARQRRVMTAVMDGCKSLSLMQMMSLLDEILPLITTDMTDSEIIRNASEVFAMLNGCTLNTQRIPADGMYQYAWVGNQSVLLLDMEKNRQLLRDTLLP